MEGLIRQRTSHDCGIAALAMFTGLSYEQVYEAGRASDGFKPSLGTSSSGSILRELGYHWDNLHTDKPKPGTRRYRTLSFPEHYVVPAFARDQLWGRPCTMSVPSLNVEGGWHLIYYNGQQVLDPQNGRRGKKFYGPDDFNKLQPRSATVWQH